MSTLIEKLNALKLTTCAQHYTRIVKEATAKNLSVSDTIQWLLDLEIEARKERSMQRCFRLSRLCEQRTIDEFDFKRHNSRMEQKNKILRLLDLDFINKGTNVIMIGNPGVGKTFLSKIIGWKACQNSIRVLFTSAMDMLNHLIAAQVDHSLVKHLKTYTNPSVLICDELGYLTLDQQTSNLFYQVISARYSFKKSTIITTNTVFSEWGTILHNTTIAAAIVDRLVEDSEIVHFTGPSIRNP
jgi:DNA replication protein DnaC